MKWSVRMAWAVLALTTALAWGQATGSEAKLDEVVKEVLGTMDKLASQLAAIKDEATAKASRDELKKTVRHWQEIRKKGEQLKPPTKEEKDRLEKEYKGKLKAAQDKLFAEIARVKGVPGGPEALKVIRALFAAKGPAKSGLKNNK